MKISYSFFLISFALLAVSGIALGADDEKLRVPTPPRLSFIEGEVSFTRKGSDDWVRARLNLPLAEGDTLYANSGDNFEVQFGSRGFARVAEKSLLSLVRLEEHYIQFKVTHGLVSFDVRSMEAGDILEVSTPYAAFIIEHPGFYRVEVGPKDTHFITYHGGRATLTTADGRSMSIYPSEHIVITPGKPVGVVAYAAPDPDAWDRWNLARTEHLIESISARYLPSDIYGAEDLDHHGFWRVVPEYGPVWIPHSMPPGWTPYSTGSWAWDPYYEWTWVDDAPWGWAPFHYGRWVYIGTYWAWVPGPVERHSVYYPALVAFLTRDQTVISLGLPGLWWVPLSWGEPLLPWWEHDDGRWHLRWDGWGGPRIINDEEVKQTTNIKVRDIRFRNTDVPGAVLSTPATKFGRERFKATTETRYRHEDFVPLQKELPIKPSSASLFGGAPKGIRPSRDLVIRPVVSTRPLPEGTLPWQSKSATTRPEAQHVNIPAHKIQDKHSLPRPPFGNDAGPERRPSPPPPRFSEAIKYEESSPASRTGESPSQKQSSEAPPKETFRSGTAGQSLPGKPANQTYGGQGQSKGTFGDPGSR